MAERDVVRPPAPPSHPPEAIADRLHRWLEATHQVRDYRARAALQAASGLGPRMTARHLLRLAEWGLVEWFCRGRTRCHHFTRGGEGALLLVVTGMGG